MNLINNSITTRKRIEAPKIQSKSTNKKKIAFCGKHKNVSMAIFPLKILRIRISE